LALSGWIPEPAPEPKWEERSFSDQQLDGQPVDSLTALSFEYFIDGAQLQEPYFNLRVESPEFVDENGLPDGARTLTTSHVAGTAGQWTLESAPLGDQAAWVATGGDGLIHCGAETLPQTFSLDELVATCDDASIVNFGLLGGIAIVTGEADGAGFVNWTGVIDNVTINANVYDLEPAQVTITPTSPVALASRSAQTVSFTLEASGWNSFRGLNTAGPVDLPIVFGTPMEVGFNAVGASSVSGSAATFPAATALAQLASQPPDVTFDLAVTAALIGNVNAINVNWTGTNAVPSPATTVLQLPAAPGPGPSAGGDLLGLVDPASGEWHLRAANGAVTSFFYGNPGDVPMVGDWDCDGVDTPGLYRQSDGFVYLRNSNTQGVADIRFFFGNPGDIPLAGDFDADGCDTVSIYRPSEQRIFVINELGANNGGLGPADFDYVFGNPGDKPFVGDFNGDGTDTVGLHRESTGLVYFRQTNTQGNADAEFIFGDPGDRFVAGDWGTVDGVDTAGLFRPGDATFYLRYTNTQGNADETVVFGDSTNLPVAGKWTP
jgi:hypothetical protein